MDDRRAQYTCMKEGTREDYDIVAAHAHVYDEGLADRVLALLGQTRGVHLGQRVDTFTHCVQTASRAHRAGEDEETVVAALLHDVGESIATWNHAEVGAGILKPYVSPDTYWLLHHHAIFQGYYYLHLYGRDRDARDRFHGHPMFDRTVEFCERYDQASFDPAYDTLPLETFEPMVRRLFARTPAHDLAAV